MSEPSDILKRAVELHKAGRLKEAKAAYAELAERAQTESGAAVLLATYAKRTGQSDPARQLLEQFVTNNPPDATVHRVLSLMCLGAGELEDASRHARTALSMEPQSSANMDVMGRALLAQNRMDEAEMHFQSAVDHASDYASGWNGLGRVAMARGEHPNATRYFQMALELSEDWPVALVNLGSALIKSGNTTEGIGYVQRATERAPNLAEAWLVLVDGLLLERRHEEAKQAAEKVIELKPKSSSSHDALGRALSALGSASEARDAFEHARALSERPANVLNNLAALRRAEGHIEESKSLLEQALSFDANRVEYWNNLGLAELEDDDPKEALACFEHGLDLSPEHVPIRLNKSLVEWMSGNPEGALETLEAGLVSGPVSFELHSRLQMVRQYSPRFAPERLRAEAEKAALNLPPTVRPQPTGTLQRLALVSADFREHPVGHAIVDVIQAWESAGVQVSVYSARQVDDALSKTIREHATQWVDCQRLSDAQLAASMADNGIDLAIDLSGHTHGNRLGAFAHGLAGVQLTWMGFFGTTGLSCFDGVLGDAVVSPSAHQSHFTEPIIQLPRCYFAVSERAMPRLDITPPPSLMNGSVRFGCFNNPCKINLDVVRNWVAVLNACEGSTLQLQYPSMIPERSGRRLRGMFEDAGLASERLLLVDGTDRLGAMRSYNHIDIALDPSPVNGGMTTIEAMWMGVPVLGIRGDRFASRIGESFVTAVGHPEWVVDTPQELVALAQRLGADTDRRLRLRQTLRQDLLASELLDASGLAAASLAVFERLVAGKP